jgi:hypothetical protein
MMVTAGDVPCSLYRNVRVTWLSELILKPVASTFCTILVKLMVFEYQSRARAIKKSGVKEIAGFTDAPGHVYYFVLETDDNIALNNAVEPLRIIGDKPAFKKEFWTLKGPRTEHVNHIKLSGDRNNRARDM